MLHIPFVKYEYYSQMIDTWGSEVAVANNTILFNGLRENVRTKETNLGNLIGDAMLSYGQNGFSEPTDFSIMNGGGIRANIHPQVVTRGDIIAVLPFGNSISQIKVTGEQVREMFEYSVRAEAQTAADGTVLTDSNGQPLLGANGGFLHVSKTVRLYYDSQKQGMTDESPGGRVLQIEIYSRDTEKFERLNDKQLYNMATNDFLAAGGDGYIMLIWPDLNIADDFYTRLNL